MKKENLQKLEAAIGTIPEKSKEYTVIHKCLYNGKTYEIEYSFLDEKDERGYYLQSGSNPVRVFHFDKPLNAPKDIHGHGSITEVRMELGGTWNNVAAYFVSSVLNTEFNRKNFEQLLSEHIKQKNN